MQRDLTAAAIALVRWHLDNVEVHPCDVNNDDILARQCPQEVQDLRAALASAPAAEPAQISPPPWKDEPPDWCTPRESEVWQMGYDEALSSCAAASASHPQAQMTGQTIKPPYWGAVHAERGGRIELSPQQYRQVLDGAFLRGVAAAQAQRGA